MNVKKKGNQWENKLANWLRDHGIKAWKDGMSGGGNREKGDVGNNIDMTIESKACKNIKLMEWWRQVDRSASMQKNQPVLFIHQDGMPDNEWLVTMHSEDWAEMVLNGSKLAQKESIGVKSGNSTREMEYTLQRAIESNKQLLKELKKQSNE